MATIAQQLQSLGFAPPSGGNYITGQAQIYSAPAQTGLSNPGSPVQYNWPSTTALSNPKSAPAPAPTPAPAPPSNVIPTGYGRRADGSLYNLDVNAGSDPNHPQGWGIDFGWGDAAKAAYDAYPGQVDAAYSNILGSLDQQKKDVNAGYGDLEKTFTGGIDAQRPILDQALAQGQQQTITDTRNEQQRNADVLTQARRLFGELQQGVQQRYGGSSSAGQFANEFYGREQARQTGQAQVESGKNIQAIVQRASDLKEKYTAQLQSLEAQRGQAVAQAKDTLYQRLKAIDDAKLGAEQNKASMKLAALQQMQQQLFQVQAQAMQYQQQLQAQREAADLQLRNAVQSYQQTAGGATSVNSYGVTNPGTISASQTNAFNPNSLIGSYGPPGKKITGYNNGYYSYDDNTWGPGGFLKG